MIYYGDEFAMPGQMTRIADEACTGMKNIRTGDV